MKIKFLYNTLLTVGMVFVFLSAVASYQHGRNGFLAISILLFFVIVWLKIKLLKDVKQTIKSKK